MSYADKVFARTCATILVNGTRDDGVLGCRPKWADGSPATTVHTLYVQNRYDLSDGSIPVMALRKQGFRNAIDEILWIYQKKSNDVRELHSHIWDQWTVGDSHTTNHTIGKAYGYQIGQRFRHHKYQPGEMVDSYPSAIVSGNAGIRIGELVGAAGGSNVTVDIPPKTIKSWVDQPDKWVLLDQMDAVLWDLKNNPGSRRIMTNTYNHADLADMGLAPCAYQVIFNVATDGEGDKVLNACLNQRSQDMLTANNWNVMQYAVLVHMVARHVGMKPGIFVHNIADCHIYDRHERIIGEMLNVFLYSYHHGLHMLGEDWSDLLYTDDNGKLALFNYIDAVPDDQPHPNPVFWMNPDKHNFYDFTLDDFRLEDYGYEPFEHKFEVAV